VTEHPAIDDYLDALPTDQREALQRFRDHVRRVVPDAVETISYRMPAFRLHGRFLLSYAGWKAHCSIYPLTDAFLAAHADELEGYERTRGSLHFTPETPLPEALVTALVEGRIADLESGGREAIGEPPASR
jgi:uncharacterized protein YdhG (YjbR/CyaY superfamily)